MDVPTKISVVKKNPTKRTLSSVWLLFTSLSFIKWRYTWRLIQTGLMINEVLYLIAMEHYLMSARKGWLMQSRAEARSVGSKCSMGSSHAANSVAIFSSHSYLSVSTYTEFKMQEVRSKQYFGSAFFICREEGQICVHDEDFPLNIYNQLCIFGKSVPPLL